MFLTWSELVLYSRLAGCITAAGRHFMRIFCRSVAVPCHLQMYIFSATERSLLYPSIIARQQRWCHATTMILIQYTRHCRVTLSTPDVDWLIGSLIRSKAVTIRLSNRQQIVDTMLLFIHVEYVNTTTITNQQPVIVSWRLNVAYRSCVSNI